jgi:hypothetical protein
MASSTSTIAPPERSARSFLTGEMAFIWAIVLAKLAFHIYFNNRYGYFRDEFDYMACGDHLQWGYVDQPPLIPFLLHICRAVFGDSLRSIRLVPALASSLLVVQTAAVARELGGKRFALLLSAVCVVVAPQYLSNGSLLGTNSLEPNLWMVCAYFAILAIKRDAPRYWLWVGVIAGIGLEEKYTIALFGLGIVVGLLLTGQRRVLLSKWMWLGGAAAFLIFLPNLLWNMHYDWPFLQLMHNIRAEGRDVVRGPVDFFWQQILIVNPLTGVVWLPGVFALFLSRRLKPFRFLGWSYVVCYTALFLLHGKNYYLSPIYPMLMAAGAVWIEAALDRAEFGQRWVQRWKPASVIVLLANGVYLAPVVIPVLSPEKFLSYVHYLPIKLPVNEYYHSRAALPQWYSDQFGWKEIADEALVAWNQIPANERGGCAIFAQNYGQAGAIDFFDHGQGLPPVISGDRTYWLWGPRRYSGDCMLVLGDRKERLQQLFSRVEYLGTSTENPWALQRPAAFYLCRNPSFGSLRELWPKIKHWN